MPTKLRFEVQGKSPLVYLTFYNDNFEKKLAKVNSEELSYNYNDFLQENEVESLNPGQGLEIGPDSVKVYKNNELIYEDFEYLEDVEEENTHPPIVLVSEFDAEVTNVLSHKQNIEVSSFWTEFSDFTQKYNYCSIEKVECYKAKGTVTIDIEEDIVPHYKDFEWVTMGYDTEGLAAELVSYGIDTSLIGVKYKNTFYKFDCTNEGGFNEYTYNKKVDGQWEWSEDFQYKIEEMS